MIGFYKKIESTRFKLQQQSQFSIQILKKLINFKDQIKKKKLNGIITSN